MALEYESRGRGFESYSPYFHSHKLSRMFIFAKRAKHYIGRLSRR